MVWVQIEKWNARKHTLQTRSGVTSTWPLWCYMYFFFIFFSLLCKGRMALKWGWEIEGSFIHLAHTHTHTPPSQAFHLYSHRHLLFCQSCWREEGEGERGRETEEGCQGRSEKSGWRRRRKKTASDLSFLFHAKPSTDLPHLLLSGERVKRAQLLCTVILVSSSSTLPLFNCILRILLILLLLGPPAPPALFLCPSLASPLGLTSVGWFQSVCLLMTPLGADVMLSSCFFALQYPPYPTHLLSSLLSPHTHISLSPPPVSLMFLFIYVSFCSDVAQA